MDCEEYQGRREEENEKSEERECGSVKNLAIFNRDRQTDRQRQGNEEDSNKER